MNNDNRTPLTILEACTLLARETVSMLEGLDQLPASAVTLRGALALAGEDLGDGGTLLAWVDSEMEMVRQLAFIFIEFLEPPCNGDAGASGLPFIRLEIGQRYLGMLRNSVRQLLQPHI